MFRVFLGLLLDAFPTSGLLRQRFGQLLDLLFHFGLRGLQLSRLCFEPGLFGVGTLLLDLQLLLGAPQVSAESSQLDFESIALFADLGRLLLSRLPAFGL